MENQDIQNKKSANFMYSAANVNSNDIDEETNNKLKGDSIGNTLYSQRFVVKLLLQLLEDVEWNEELEENLCFLWDMTLEKDVCKYLFDISYPSVACAAITRSTENRFIEIVIGILANIISCDWDKKITKEEINIVLKELDTDDHLILIQIVRFISGVAYMSKESFLNENVLNVLEFILCNSVNSELLTKTLEAVAKTTIDCKLDVTLVKVSLIQSAITGFKSVIFNESDEFTLDTSEKLLSCKHMLEIISNICTYLNRFEDGDLIIKFHSCSIIILEEFVKILNYYSYEQNLLPVSAEFIFFMAVIKYVAEILCIDNYLSEMVLPVTKIILIIYDIKDEVSELWESAIEMECYLFHKSESKNILKNLQKFSKKDVLKILGGINNHSHKLDYKLNLQYIFDKYKLDQ